jgi:hypothetical protein
MFQGEAPTLNTTNILSRNVKALAFFIFVGGYVVLVGGYVLFVGSYVVFVGGYVLFVGGYLLQSHSFCW